MTITCQNRGGQVEVECTYCGAKFMRYWSQITKKDGSMRKVFKCQNCRRAPIDKLFWPKVDMSGGEDACWPFCGARHPDGYGNFEAKFSFGKETRSNRIAYILSNGELEIPIGLYILHKWHYPACCNPKHLYAGNQSQNMQDCIAAGRRNDVCGMNHKNAVLTSDAVVEIRRTYRRGNVAYLANKFRVSIATIRDVAKARSWKHINTPAAPSS